MSQHKGSLSMANRLTLSSLVTLVLSLSGCLTCGSLPPSSLTSDKEILAPGPKTISFKENIAKNYGASLGRSQTLQPVLPVKAAAMANPVKSIWERVVAEARNYLHLPYRLGSSLRNGKATDCSGFVQYVYNEFDIDLPRSSAAQARVGEVAAHTMDFAKLQPGDLLFFRRNGKRIGHVGIYAGNGQMIHAATRGTGVIVSDLSQPYYEHRFVVAKRIL